MITIPEVEIEIGQNLFLRIKDVSFLPAVKGCTSAAPEDCYEDEPAEADWRKEDVSLIIKKFEWVESLNKKRIKKLIKEIEFTADDNLAYYYYEQIIEAIEEMKE